MKHTMTLLSILLLIPHPGWANSLSDGIASSSMADPNSVSYDKKNDGNGREYKAAEAASMGGKGKGAAIAAGVAMISAGAPMTASIDPFIVAAGIDLMAKGGLELAQAGATGGTEQKNRGQNGLLRASANQDGASLSGSSGNSPLNIPALNKVLADKGINPDDFIKQLQSGQLPDAGSIANALGVDAPSPEAMAGGQAIANDQIQQIMGLPEPNGNETPPRVVSDEGAPRNEAAGGSSGGTTTPGATTGGGGSYASVGGLQGGGLEGGAGAGGVGGGSFRLNGKTDGHEGEGAGSLEASMGGMLSKFFGGKDPGDGADGVNKSTSAAMARWALARMGIQIRNKRESIFQMSHRHYRAFGKWKKQVRVVARVEH